MTASQLALKINLLELVNCLLLPFHPCLSRSFSFSFFLNKTLLEPKVSFESQVILGVSE